jgi:hypothetical protein
MSKNNQTSGTNESVVELEEIPSGSQPKISSQKRKQEGSYVPEAKRARIYNYFDYDEVSKQYKCKNCRY